MQENISKNIIKKIYKVIVLIISLVISFLLLVVFWRIFIADRFIIPSNSMYPTLMQGDRVLVNKLIIGARIYNKIDHEKLDIGKHDCIRIRGIRNVRHNDILIFNFPKTDGKIFFKMNYVYVKRVIGLPGDSVSAKKGYYKNNNYFYNLGNLGNQELLNSILEENINKDIRYVFKHNLKEKKWTIKNFGPLYVPRKGDVKKFTKDNILPYSDIIEYESKKDIDSFFNNKSDTLVYRFKSNYYFMAGDNVLNSYDSRYWGFLPENFIVGVVYAVLFSKDSESDNINYKRTKIFNNCK